MPKFGTRSKKHLATCHPSLQKLFETVVVYFDCSVLCGYRGKEEQDEAYRQGRSTKKYPLSRHNKQPSKAVDVVPYPIDWNDKERFYFFAGFVKGIATLMGIDIRWGGDWDSDTEVHDQTFFDLPHFELKERDV